MTTDFARDRCVTFPEISRDLLGLEPGIEKIFDLATVLLGEMCHFAPPVKICKSKRTSPSREGGTILSLYPSRIRMACLQH